MYKEEGEFDDLTQEVEQLKNNPTIPQPVGVSQSVANPIFKGVGGKEASNKLGLSSLVRDKMSSALGYFGRGKEHPKDEEKVSGR